MRKDCRINEVGSIDNSVEFTILMLRLNEAEILVVCIDKATRFLRESNVSREILIANNGSTDGSREIKELVRGPLTFRQRAIVRPFWARKSRREICHPRGR